MPRRKRNTRNKVSTLTNSTIMCNDSEMIEERNFTLKMMRAEIKEKMKNAYQQLCNMEREKLQLLDSLYKNAIMAIPKSVLNAPCDLENEDFRSIFFGEKEEFTSTKDDCCPIKSPVTVKRRSRSASCKRNRKETTLKLRNSHFRSTSVDVYKTPTGKVRLSTIMSQKKYTVTKPKKTLDSGVKFKRIMRPNEEAISVCGSPLHVGIAGQSSIPQATIPLPGGVVLNVEAKETRGRHEFPALDEKTKSQIKLLCDQLNSLFN